MNTKNLFKVNAVATAILACSSAQAAQVFTTDVIIQGSNCVGFDCVNGESFGFDTIRLKENNLRINFQDTSNSASFPSNDWRLVANDTGNGGANYFAIEDSTAGRTPFKVEAAAPANTLYVEADGDVGIKTANPVVDLHVVEGNTPTLRLEQDGSDGFTPQTWDVAGNEANFFIRDVTNGSKLSFRIEPGAPESSVHIDNAGNVGLGNSNPNAALDIVRSNGTAKVEIHENSSSEATRTLLDLKNKGASWITMENTAANKRVLLQYNATQGFNITLQNLADGSYVSAFVIDSAGNITLNGDLTVNGSISATGSITPNTP
ncbi:hypothetical protein [Pseudoalteromonas spongiae]|uniref:hypothetical protein n=1 Tax=Pseudoalteromonas spongiae TaxID=298657 RepID=UPI00110ADB2B|nr:hypothetical protein [Pseudoalteromonas spongiae]TMO82042.1 hypothetical protein CWC15_20385 [Pseudoalteromonas spongiae]